MSDQPVEGMQPTRCYLCNEPLGKPCELVCEKGPNIVVCGDCWDEAIDEERIDRELIEGLYDR